MTSQSASLSTPASATTGERPASAGWWRELPRFLAVTAQLALILLTIHLFKIEPNLPFLAVMCLAAGGFVVHAWLPSRFRLAFFCVLSLASAVLLLGWSTAGWLLGLGGGLIALCYLPAPWAYRLLLISCAGLFLALVRMESTEPFWPILGSMFMFRFIIYVFDFYHERVRPSLLHTLAYFFTLPNLCFLFFPVVDFKTFRETYYNDEPYNIYQTGIGWIVRGLTHLLAYRFIKYYLLPSPHHVTDLPHLLLFLATNYALYMRVSGWFHIITGTLHLFGFNLPRTHHNYFLASSVSDVWRRINIYWKDFMAKIFFYPVFFALHRWGRTTALMIASLWVFVVTWLLHSYQVFWLRAELPIAGKDAALWLTAGVAVALSLQLDVKHARKTSRSAPPASDWEWWRHEALSAAIHTLKIIGTFLLVSLFWARWTVPGFVVYLAFSAALRGTTLSGFLAVGACVASIVAVGVSIQLVWAWLRRRGLPPRPPFVPYAVALQAAVLLVLMAAGIPQAGESLDPRIAEVLATLRLETDTPLEAAMAVQGYYEHLADTHVQAEPLLALPGLSKKGRPPPVYTDMSRPADDFLERELIPRWSGEVEGHHLTINSLGLRDREGITREKPAGVCRLTFVGSSVVMGYGTGDDETFTRLLERHLNADPLTPNPSPPKGGEGGKKTPLSPLGRGVGGEGGRRRIEVLNFGTGKSYAIHRLTMIERKVFAFSPDALYYVAHQDEYLGIVRHLAMLLHHRDKLPAYLRDLMQEAGVGPEMAPGLVEIRLQPLAPRILREIYADLVQQCRQRGILPVWIYLPMPGVRDAASESSELIELAKEAGFIALNLTKWDAGHAPEEVKSGRYHANPLGHQLIAERLSLLLRQQPEALPACARP